MALCAVLWLVPAAQALDPNRLMEQYIRDRWTEDQGYPGGAVYAFAQTPDGYLWIGGEKGLVRFDGLSFHVFNNANTPELPSSPVLGLATDTEGSLWIRLQTPAVVRYRRGVFEPMDQASGVTAMGYGKTGGILLVRTYDPLVYRDGKFTHLPMVQDYKALLVISLAETAGGWVWMGTRDNGMFGLLDGRAIEPGGAPDRKVNCLLAGDGENLWVGTDRGLGRWDGNAFRPNVVPAELRTASIMALARDRDRNLWVGSQSGLMRLTAQGAFSAETTGGRPAEPVGALFEDREGNVWIGRVKGFERYRERAFLSYPPPVSEGSENSGPVYADGVGRVWFGPSTGGLYWLKGAEVREAAGAGVGRDVVYSIDGGGGELWIGRQRGGLTRLRVDGDQFTAETFTAADGLAAGPVYTVHRCRDGTVWAGALNGGLSRWRDGRLTTYTTATGLPSNAISAMAEDADGTMWFATAGGLSAFAHERWRVYTSQDGVPPGRIDCLYTDAGGMLWIGSVAGLSSMHDGHAQPARDAPEPLLDEVLGVAADVRGDLWIATTKRVVRVERGRLLANGAGKFALREFGPTDGIPAPEGVRRDRSVIRDAGGRIWFSLRRGIATIDPARLTTDSIPAIVQIQSVSADGSPVEGGGQWKIPAGRQRVRFGFQALSLAAPERVQYRYRLDDFDSDWSEPAPARETVYTNLGPGSYRFRVIASNSEGIWNSAEAAIAVNVAPAMWQTLWFRTLLVLTFVLGAVAAHHMRMRRLTVGLRIRFEERLSERTRIAQELHDTLLQGLLATSMQLSVAVDRLPEDSPVRPLFLRVASMMSQMAAESRNAVQGLRSHAPGVDDLESAFSRLHEDSVAADRPEFRIIVEGPTRPLNPLIRDEVYRIGREAVTNAFRHSGGAKVEMEIHYDAGDLRLAVRDGGKGIDPEVLRLGRDGHWGLIGMRERAEKIGGRLKVWSRAAAGTEVELTVPGHIAFSGPALAVKRRWWLAWRRNDGGVHAPASGE